MRRYHTEVSKIPSLTLGKGKDEYISPADLENKMRTSFFKSLCICNLWLLLFYQIWLMTLKWEVECFLEKCLWQSSRGPDLYALLSSSLIKLDQIHSLSKLTAGGRSKWIFTYFWWCTIQSCCLCSIMLYANMMHHTMWDWQTYKGEQEQF